MKNLKPIGIPALDLPGEPVPAHLRLDQAERRRRARSLLLPDQGLLQGAGRRSQDADPRHQRREVVLPLQVVAGQGRRHHHARSKKASSYRLKEITFTGNKAVKNTRGLRSLFKIKDGDIFDTEADPQGPREPCARRTPRWATSTSRRSRTPTPTTRRSTISLRIDLDEGKQFYVRRIEFQGNTTTRDKVIRRELALEEGQVYNGNLWELSLLRLNQLQYFEPAEARAGFGNQAERRRTARSTSRSR